MTFSSADLFEFVKIDYMLKATNFDLKPVDGDDLTEFPYPEEDANSWFLKLNSNVHGVMVSLRSLELYSNLSDYALIHSEEFCYRFSVLIPKKHTILFPIEIFFFLFVFPGCIFGFLYLNCKIFENDVNTLQTIQILVGQAVNHDFRKISSKVIFFTVIIIYTFIYNDIYYIITNT